MLNPLVVYIFDKPGGYQELMEKQLDPAGIERLPDEIPAFTWGNRIKRTLQIAQQYPGRVLCFVDAWDTLFIGKAWELDNVYWGSGITFASQKQCWPDLLDLKYNVYWEDMGSTRWRYLNSNPMIGLGANIAEAISWGWERFPLPGLNFLEILKNHLSKILF